MVETSDTFRHDWDDVMAEDLRSEMSTWEASLFGRRAGHRLFDGVTDQHLELISAKSTPTGAQLVRYRPKAS